jgi:hypothetical protein
MGTDRSRGDRLDQAQGRCHGPEYGGASGASEAPYPRHTRPLLDALMMICGISGTDRLNRNVQIERYAALCGVGSLENTEKHFCG